MAKGKDARTKVILKYTGRVSKSVNKESTTFSHIILKRINTIRLVGWNCENYIPIITGIQFMER